MLTARLIALSISLTVLAAGACPVFASEPRYLKLLEKGQYSLKRKDYESAVATFTQVLKENPQVYEAYLSRAAARKELKDTDGALSDYEQAIKTNANATEIYLQRGALLAQLGDREGALADYNEVLRLDPKDGRVRLLRAEALKENGDYAGACKDYDQYLKSNPSELNVRRQRAECSVNLDAFDQAISDYEYILKKGGSRAFDIQYEWGEALKLKGDTRGATEHFNQVVSYYTKNLSRSKKNGIDFLYRGMAYFELSELDKALCDLENGVRLLPDDALAHSKLAHVQLAKGETAEALKNLDTAIKLNPRLQAALLDRGTIKAAQGNYWESKEDLDRALIVSKNADCLYARAMTLLALGDVSGASEDLSGATKLDPQLMEEKRKKLASLIESASTNSQSREKSINYNRLALFDLSLGDLDSAERLVRQSIKLEKENKQADSAGAAGSLLLLGQIYLKQHQLSKAEAMFRTALAKLSNVDNSQKYAVFSLEQCATQLLLASKLEEAGSIFTDTRLLRATHGWNENALSADLSKRAEQAVEAYKLKRKYDRQEDLVRKAATSSSSESEGGESASALLEINRPIRDKWALIVGTSKFKDSKLNLRFAAKDAQDFSNFLIKEKNFAPDHVQLLINEAATRANILSLLGSRWLPRVAEKDDLVVIYFSTHGSPSSLDVGGVNYLVVHDTDPADLFATGIAMQDLARIIKARVHSDRIMLVLDACHSGATGPSAGKSIDRVANIDVEPIVQGTGQLVISSSKPDQRSWESQRYDGSVFTRYLIDGFRKNGEQTKLGDAYSYLETEVQREVLRDRGVLQTPVMRSKWRGSDLILGAKPAHPSSGLGPIELPDSVDSQTDTNTGKAVVVRAKSKTRAGTSRRSKGEK